MNTPYYKLTPISEPPKEDGFYLCVYENLTAFMKVSFKKGSWYYYNEGRDPIENQWMPFTEYDLKEAKLFYLAPCSSLGTVWRKLRDGSGKIPPSDKEVLFDGDGIPPVWAKCQVDKFGPYLIISDSSGEEEREDILNYERWLDESGTPDTRIEEMEREVARLGDVINDLFDIAMGGSCDKDKMDSLLNFAKQHNL